MCHKNNFKILTSSSSSSLTRFNATISCVSLCLALKTVPYVPKDRWKKKFPAQCGIIIVKPYLLPAINKITKFADNTFADLLQFFIFLHNMNLISKSVHSEFRLVSFFVLEKLNNLEKFTEPIQHSADDNKTSSRPCVCFFHRRPGTKGRLHILLTALAQPERVNKLLSGEGFRRVVALDFVGGNHSPHFPNFWNSSFNDVRILWSRPSGESWGLKIEYFVIKLSALYCDPQHDPS